ncbi:hypothetical protein PsYK624_136080 [Phanerochaete sordida]|uniref:Uncharacterized protein n=1 Tax=Phanerochaete sordida TaxID=48140 RepID=A0A9P3LJC1_9APHY|nr:hypothetical protein PsYK624_136080 [Phanerochaete sordida]
MGYPTDSEPWPVLRRGETVHYIRFKSYVGQHWADVYPDRPLASGSHTLARVATVLWETLPRNRKQFWLSWRQSGTILETRRAMRAFIEQRRAADGYASDGDGYDWDDVHSHECAIRDAIVAADAARANPRQSILVVQSPPDHTRREELNGHVRARLRDDFGVDAVQAWDRLPQDDREDWLRRKVRYLDSFVDITRAQNHEDTAAFSMLFEDTSVPGEPMVDDILTRVIKKTRNNATQAVLPKNN